MVGMSTHMQQAWIKENTRRRLVKKREERARKAAAASVSAKPESASAGEAATAATTTTDSAAAATTATAPTTETQPAGVSASRKPESGLLVLNAGHDSNECDATVDPSLSSVLMPHQVCVLSQFGFSTNFTDFGLSLLSVCVFG